MSVLLFSKKPVETLWGSLKSLRPITLELVSGSDLEPVWDYLVKQYHYLGYQNLLGHRLKYLALVRASSCGCPFLERCSPESWRSGPFYRVV